MSRTKPSEHETNPTEYKMEWVGHEAGGYFSVWNRDEKKEIKVELPLRFAFLDCTKAVGGFLENVSRSPYSNEVRYTKHQPFDVRYYKDGNQHPVAKGLWNDIKGDIGQKGAKFVNVVYATLLTSTSDEVPGGSLVKLPLMGAAGSSWINLDIADGQSFSITGFEDKKKGRTSYRAPVFELIDISDDESATADEQDEALQKYLSSVIGNEEKVDDDKPPALDKDAPAEEPHPDGEYVDNVPF